MLLNSLSKFVSQSCKWLFFINMLIGIFNSFAVGLVLHGAVKHGGVVGGVGDEGEQVIAHLLLQENQHLKA